MSIKKISLAAALGFASVTGSASAGDEVRIVGSSTVYPFSTVVAERFGRTSAYKTPIVESTGTGGGFKLFCADAGPDTIDVSNASRAVKDSEIKLCASNGVNNIIEVKIGYDGIVLANSNEADRMELTVRDIFLALASKVPAGTDGELKENDAVYWSDVNADLPKKRIEVLGPPPTSGTRDAFAELAMEGGCKTFDWIKAVKKSDKSLYKEICHSVREDGVYIEAGENDNLIVQKLSTNPEALGIFGYSFLDQNGDKVQASLVNGVEVNFDTIADGSYPIARSLFFYVKGENLDTTPALGPFLQAFISEEATGEDGYLADRGLIPLSAEERSAMLAKIESQLK